MDETGTEHLNIGDASDSPRAGTAGGPPRNPASSLIGGEGKVGGARGGRGQPSGGFWWGRVAGKGFAGVSRSSGGGAARVYRAPAVV